MNPPKIYISYREKDKARLRCVESIHKLLVNKFGFQAWFYKDSRAGIHGGQSIPEILSKQMDWANNFLLIAHRNTHDSEPVKGEINAAIKKYNDKEYKKLVVLIIDRKVNIKKLNIFLRDKTYVKVFKKGWEQELRNSFLNEKEIGKDEIYEKIFDLFKNNNSRKTQGIVELVQKITSLPKRPATLIETLQLLLSNTKEERQKTKINLIINTLKREEILKELMAQHKPDNQVLRKHNLVLVNIKSEHSKVLQDLCKLYEGLIYLLKPFNTKDQEIIKKIRLLGITLQGEKIIKHNLLKDGILTQTGDILWFVDDKLGRKAMDDAFFGRNKIIDFAKIEGLFYGQK
jgi:hypothetical protein